MEVPCPSCHRIVTVDLREQGTFAFCDHCSESFHISASDAPDAAVTFVPSQNTIVPELLASVGDYEIIHEVSRGGMGIVYKARQISLNRIVALKMVLAGEFASSEQLSRFRNEARAVARLDHPNIVPVYETGEHQGLPYLSMAFIDGGSLHEKLKIQPLSENQAVDLLLEICRAVQYAHDHHVIHRDLKPANILLDRHGTPRVSDFGLAKRLQTAAELTLTGQVIGTPAYMPPEQALGSPATPLSDQYSLGATLYHMLTGRPPFLAATPHETLSLVISQEPVLLRILNPTVSRDLETICLKCLRKDPQQRYPSVQVLAEDLQRWKNGEAIIARPVSRRERVYKWMRRHPWIAATGAVTAVAIGLSLSLSFVLQTGQAERKKASSELAWKEHMEQSLTADRLVSLAQTGDYREAVAEAQRLFQKKQLSSMMSYDLACVYSLASSSAANDELEPAETRSARETQYLTESLNLLELALIKGYFHVPEQRVWLTQDPHLSALRSDQRFQNFLEQLKDRFD